MYLYRAIRKHGEKNFYIEELEICEVEDLNEKERYYIQKYNSIEEGYNTALVFDSYYIKRIDLNIGKARYLYEVELKTLDYIAKELNTSRFIITQELRKLGVNIRPNGHIEFNNPKLNKEEISDYLNRGFSYRKIAKITSIPYPTIRKYCIEYNLSKSTEQPE